MRRFGGQPDRDAPSPGPRRRRAALLATAGVAAIAVAAGVLTASGALHSDSSAATGRKHAPTAVRSASAAGPAGGLTPGQIRQAYDLTPLIKAGVEGRGQTIVIVDSFGSPTAAADLKHFDSYFQLPAPPSFTVLQPAGRVPAFHASNGNRVGWAQETTLDVEWAHVMAPAARIVLVETPTSENEGTTGFPQIVTAEKYVLRHKLGQVISQSFAATEQTFPSKSDYAALRDLRGAYQLAARDHVTVLAATGDTGATSETYSMKSLYTTRAVSWPATDPLVTAVGGTQLDVKASGDGPAVAWNNSGGGRSIVFGRPSYQNSVKNVTGSHRGIPDISMDASCSSAVAIYGSFYASGGQWTAICGTSLATPLFAGVVALADQVAGHGKAHGLGVINPAIYKMAAAGDRGIVDITKGDNTHVFSQGGVKHTVEGFNAGPGYDLVSGVGTVDARYFVPELAKLAG